MEDLCSDSFDLLQPFRDIRSETLGVGISTEMFNVERRTLHLIIHLWHRFRSPSGDAYHV